MRQSLILLFTLVTQALQAQDVTHVERPLDYVNVLMGTQSVHLLSNGNTYPAIARPWGMNFWSPQTGKMGDGWMYTYTADKIDHSQSDSLR